MLKVFYPESRQKDIKDLLQNAEERFTIATHRTITELREANRQNDHKFRSLPAYNLWISDIGGRRGGRLLYFKKNNQLIIWGISPDHSIEEEAIRYFQNIDRETQIINGTLIDVTADYLLPEEIEEIKNKTKLFAGNLSDEFLKEKLMLTDYQISEIRKTNEITLWDLNVIDDVCRYKLWKYYHSISNVKYAVFNEAHLFDFIKGSKEKLMIHLDDEQEKIVALAFDNSQLIKGETGSGKTTILLYKAVFHALAHEDHECILFTFNLSLANMIKEAVEELNGKYIKNLSIYGFYEWIEDLSQNYHPDLSLFEKTSNVNTYDLFESFYSDKDLKSLGFKQKHECNFFLKKEIDEVILEYAIESEKDYLRKHRHGRDRILGKNQRSIVWSIYEKYLSYLEKNKLTIYPLMIKNMLPICKRADFEFKMDAIFVDEIQDLTPVCIRIISALRRKSDRFCILTGDYKQSIYRRSFRWTDVKLPFHGANVMVLKKNYRNTVEILDEAYKLAKSFKLNWEKPLNSGRNGKPVERIIYKAENKISMLKTLINYAVFDQNIQYSDIAIFGVSRKIESLADLLDKEGVPSVYIKKQDSHYQKNAVKISTLHSAKGLEFRMVILIDIEKELFNFICHNERQKETIAIKLLYVGMTRAYDCLFFMLKENPQPQTKLEKFLYGINE